MLLNIIYRGINVMNKENFMMLIDNLKSNNVNKCQLTYLMEGNVLDLGDDIIKKCIDLNIFDIRNLNINKIPYFCNILRNSNILENSKCSEIIKLVMETDISKIEYVYNLVANKHILNNPNWLKIIKIIQKTDIFKIEYICHILCCSLRYPNCLEIIEQKIKQENMKLIYVSLSNFLSKEWDNKNLNNIIKNRLMTTDDINQKTKIKIMHLICIFLNFRHII